LRIAVLGDSMSAGHGCLDEGEMRANHSWPPPPDAAGRTWSARLSELLEGLGLGPINMNNLAHPSLSAVFLQTHYYALEKVLSTVDLVLVAYSLDDINQDANSTINVVRTLRNLPQKPAVVFVETFDRRLPFSCEEQNVTRMVHWPALVAERIPTVSYTEAFCPRKRLPNVGAPGASLFWEGRIWDAATRSDHDPWSEPSFRARAKNDNSHPYCLPAHELLAQMVAALIVEASTAEVCADAAEVDLIGVKSKACTTNAATKLDPFVVDGRGVLSVKERSAGQIDFPGFSPEHAWELRMDRPGKPGWVARPGMGSYSTVIFPVKLGPQGRVVVQYLRSYASLGNATCRLEGAPKTMEQGPELFLDGRWKNLYSLDDIATFEVEAALKKHCQENMCKLRCKAGGEKFVVRAVLSC